MISTTIDFGPKEQAFFDDFVQSEKLTAKQANQFKTYLLLLLEWNEKFNLTAITSVEEVIKFHFQDSLALDRFIDFNAISSIADVGTGAGLPGIPLKIKYPHLTVFLIEVNNKKISFLNMIFQELGLTESQTIDLDWRTFLRKTDFAVDIFVSRASLAPAELIRIFKPGCPYQNAQLVYWASKQWVSSELEAPLIEKTVSYMVGNRERQFIFFKKIDVY
ncbi:MAG: Ribosomal RNA small subunit methyltransferase G [Candidatus Dependentiae bacterium ADurb.Bin331]|nr:MAG: Ribosomal RNA small subunit methyltransferase G [Candidatus Dependentiae bacterium ADurb.Bin331]